MRKVNGNKSKKISGRPVPAEREAAANRENNTDRKTEGKAVRYFDYRLFAVVVFLMCFGLVMLYSTSAYSARVTYGDSMYYFKRQLKFAAIGIGVMLIVARLFDYHCYALLSWLVFAAAFILMGLIKSPLGVNSHGTRRGIKLPFGFQMQPSEVMKLAIVILIPFLICKAGKKIKEPKKVLTIFLIGAAGAAGVFFLADNLSTAIIVLGMVCFMLFVAHPKTWPFMAITAGGTVLVAIAIKIIDSSASVGENFRLTRILSWLHPEDYSDAGSFQAMQGLYAIGSGGFFGKGLGNSTQKTVIPEVQNDMILAIICEELGVFGVIVLLTLFGLLLYRLMFIALNAPDLYGSLMVTGIFAHIAIQVIFNVAVVLNLFPTTGITLPFISYGGSSVVFLMIEMGIALGVSSKIKIAEPEENEMAQMSG